MGLRELEASWRRWEGGKTTIEEVEGKISDQQHIEVIHSQPWMVYQYQTHCWLYLLRKPACSGPQPIYPPCRQMLTFTSSLSPHTPTLFFWWSLGGGASFGVGEGGDCGGCGAAR